MTRLVSKLAEVFQPTSVHASLRPTCTASVPAIRVSAQLRWKHAEQFDNLSSILSQRLSFQLSASNPVWQLALAVV